MKDLRTKDDRLVLEVQGKGSHEADRIAVIPKAQERVVRSWAMARKKLPGDALFCSVAPQNAGDRLSTRAIRGMVKSRYQEAGVVGNRKTTHSLRHSAVTNAIRHGAAPLQVQAMTGHGSFDTTLGYFHAESRTANPAEDLIHYGGQVTGGACVPTSPCRTGFAPQEGACEFSRHMGFGESLQRLHEKVRTLGRARADNPSGKR